MPLLKARTGTSGDVPVRRAPASPRCAAPAAHAVQRSEDAQVLPRRQIRIQPRLIGQHAQLPPQRLGRLALAAACRGNSSSPALGRVREDSSRSSVDLPAPFSPSSRTISPGAMSKVTSRSTVAVAEALDDGASRRTRVSVASPSSRRKTNGLYACSGVRRRLARGPQDQPPPDRSPRIPDERPVPRTAPRPGWRRALRQSDAATLQHRRQHVPA